MIGLIFCPNKNAETNVIKAKSNEPIVIKQPINVLIAQKNPELANTLKNYIKRFDSSINIIGNPTSIIELEKYLIDKDQLDIAFIETRLSDGQTFDLLTKQHLDKPVIFTSPSKEDAFKAIKLNGVDYLIEPLIYDDFSCAIEKALKQAIHNHNAAPDYKKRFLVKIGDKLKYKNVEDISYIFAEGKTVYIVSKIDKRKYIVEYTMDELEKRYLNPQDFFRINRKFIINVDVVEEVRNYVNSRLKLILNPPADPDMIVSRDKVVDFKNWLNL